MCAAKKVASIAAAALLFVAPGDMHAQMDREILIYDHDQGLAGADFSNRKDLVGAIFSKANAKVRGFANSRSSISRCGGYFLASELPLLVYADLLL